MQKNSDGPPFDVWAFLKQNNLGSAVTKYHEGQTLYAQGDPADFIFYVHKGKVKVTVMSKHGKEAVVAIRGPDEFCGEGALTGKPKRLATLITMSACEVMRLEKEAVVRLLHQDAHFADYFLNHLLTRTARVEADLRRSIVQFQRDAAGPGAFAVGELWRRRRRRTAAGKSESRNTCRVDWHHAGPGECIHEQIQEDGLDRVQRKPDRSKRAVELRSARSTAPQSR